MKFRNIKQMTVARYQVDISWNYIEDTIERYIKEDDLEIQPDFQRTHVWNDIQRKRYIEWILRGGQSGKELLFNHPNWMGSFKGSMVLVDGLQRLTSVRMFMNNEISIFNNLYFHDFDDRIPENCGFIFKINNLKTRTEVKFCSGISTLTLVELFIRTNNLTKFVL